MPVATASPEEAAAISAALERFLADTAPAPVTAGATSPWLRAALREGIAKGRLDLSSGWGP
ncbi:MAG: hypothetical protein ACXWDP_02260 [Solirubrobacterales bacterium]